MRPLFLLESLCYIHAKFSRDVSMNTVIVFLGVALIFLVLWLFLPRPTLSFLLGLYLQHEGVVNFEVPDPTFITIIVFVLLFSSGFVGIFVDFSLSFDSIEAKVKPKRTLQ